MFIVGTIEFTNWLKETMKQKGISQAELARRSGISPPQVSKIYNGSSEPGKVTLVAIARGLKLPAITVLRAAGILPEEPEYVPLLDEWNAIFYELTPEDQQEILEIARLKANKHKVLGKITSRRGTPARSTLKTK